MERNKALQQNDLTAEKRQSLLLSASKEYMRGKISRTQFQEAEHKYGTDYRAVTLELASKNHLISRLLQFLLSIWRSNNEKNLQEFK